MVETYFYTKFIGVLIKPHDKSSENTVEVFLNMNSIKVV